MHFHNLSLFVPIHITVIALRRPTQFPNIAIVWQPPILDAEIGDIGKTSVTNKMVKNILIVFHVLADKMRFTLTRIISFFASILIPKLRIPIGVTKAETCFNILLADSFGGIDLDYNFPRSYNRVFPRTSQPLAPKRCYRINRHCSGLGNILLMVEQDFRPLRHVYSRCTDASRRSVDLSICRLVSR